MATFTDFLTERLIEDENLAFRARRTRLVNQQTLNRAVDETQVKRKLLDLHRPSTDHPPLHAPYCVGCWEAGGMDGAPSWPCPTVRIIATVYADHPTYRDEWKP